MKVVKVEILPAKDGDVVTAVVIEETKKGGAWKEGSKEVVFSGTPAAVRTILMDDEDRLIIEGKVEAKVVYDPVQMATAYEPVSEDAKERKKKHEEEQKKRYEEFKKLDEKEVEQTEEEKERARQIKEHNERIGGKASEAPGMYGSEDRERGLRTELPADSKTVKEDHPAPRAPNAPKGR
jgi:hypothetical protein